MKNCNQVKGILTIVGGFLIHIICGSIYSWGNLNTYLISYLKITNPDLTLDQAFFFLPIGIFASTLTNILGGYLEPKLGPRMTLSIGLSLIILGHFGIYIFTDLFLDYVSISLFGIGLGISYIVPVRTAWYYFPKHKGKVVGIIIMGYGVSSSFITFLAEAIINPEGKNTDENGYYSEDVAKNMPNYILTVVIIFIFLSFIGTLIVFPYSSDRIELDPSNNSIKNNIINLISDNTKQDNNLKTKYDLYEENKGDETIANGIKSQRFIKAFFIALCYSFYPFTILNTFRSFAGRTQPNDFLKYLAIGNSIMNGFTRPFWGTLFDKFGFKKLFLILCVFQIIISSSVYFVVENKLLFGLDIVLSGGLTAGVFSLMPSLISKIYGIKFSSEIYGAVFTSFGISGILGPIFIYIINHSGLPANSTYPYLTIYLFGTLLTIVSFILCCVTGEEKFNYSTKE